MSPVAIEWIEKAEEDFKSAGREMRSWRSKNYNLVCFLSQQCAEKYMKAVLQEHDIRFGKIHDLDKLLNEITAIDPLSEALRTQCSELSPYATQFRYPGVSATKEKAKQALLACKVIRREARKILGLEK